MVVTFPRVPSGHTEHAGVIGDGYLPAAGRPSAVSREQAMTELLEPD